MLRCLPTAAYSVGGFYFRASGAPRGSRRCLHFPESEVEVYAKTSFSVDFLREALQILRECSDSRIFGGHYGRSRSSGGEIAAIILCVRHRSVSPGTANPVAAPVPTEILFFLQNALSLRQGVLNLKRRNGSNPGVKTVRAA